MHDFIAKQQAAFLHCIAIQATIHPFVVYWRQDSSNAASLPGTPQNALQSLSYIVISDCLVHDVISVHLFLKRLLNFLTVQIQGLKKVYYFTDGASSQYKNRKNLVNLAFHMNDFNVQAEWHFFATSHGKGPCNGLGGTVKHLATKASLPRAFEDQIQSAIELYEWAKGAIPSIHFQYVTTADYEAEEILLRKQLESAITIVGTHSFHVYYPMHDKTNKLEVKVYSCCPASEIVRVSSNRDLLAMEDIHGYIICAYDSRWWLALVMEKYNAQEELKVRIFHPAGPSPSFSFPRRLDELVTNRAQV